MWRLFIRLALILHPCPVKMSRLQRNGLRLNFYMYLIKLSSKKFMHSLWLLCSDLETFFFLFSLSVMKTGVISQAKGSAYLEQGSTKVVCGVYGPREIPRRYQL